MSIEADSIVYSLAADMTKLKQGLAQAEQAMASASKKMSSSMDATNKSMLSGDQAMAKLGTGAKNLAGTITGVLLPALGAAGLVRALADAVRLAADFEKAMAEVSTLLSDTSGIDALGSAVQGLAAEFGADTVTSAKAMYQIISAGATSSAEAMMTLDTANRLAIGGVTDVKTAADGLTSILNAYGLSAEHAGEVSDAMFVGMRAGKTTVGELSSSLGQAAPLASALGVSFEELIGATAAITKGGIQTAEAVTALRSVLSAVARQSDQSKEAAKELGIEFSVAAIKSEGLAGFLEKVGAAAGGDEEKLQKLFGRVEALNAVLPITGSQAESFAKIMEDMGNKAGETDKAYAKMSETFDFQSKRLGTAMTILGETIGKQVLPALTSVTKGFADFILEMTLTGAELEKFQAQLVLGEKFAEATGSIENLEQTLANLRAEYESYGEVYDEFGGATGEMTEEQERLAGAINFVYEKLEALKAITSDTSAKLVEANSIMNQVKGGFDLYAFAIEAASGSNKELAKIIAEMKAKLKEQESAARDAASGSRELDNAFKDLIKEASDALKEEDQLMEMSIRLGEAMLKNSGDSKVLAKAMELLQKEIDKTSKAQEGSNEKTKDAEKGIKDYIEKLKEEKAHLELEARSINMTAQERAALKAKLDLETQARKDNVVVTDEMIKQAQDLARETAAMQEAVDKAQDAVDTYQKIWDNAFDNIQTAWGDLWYNALWEDGIDSFGDFFNTILDMFKQLIAQMLAAWSMQFVAGILGMPINVPLSFGSVGGSVAGGGSPMGSVTNAVMGGSANVGSALGTVGGTAAANMAGSLFGAASPMAAGAAFGSMGGSVSAWEATISGIPGLTWAPGSAEAAMAAGTSGGTGITGILSSVGDTITGAVDSLTSGISSIFGGGAPAAPAATSSASAAGSSSMSSLMGGPAMFYAGAAAVLVDAFIGSLHSSSDDIREEFGKMADQVGGEEALAPFVESVQALTDIGVENIGYLAESAEALGGSYLFIAGDINEVTAAVEQMGTTMRVQTVTSLGDIEKLGGQYVHFAGTIEQLTTAMAENWGEAFQYLVDTGEYSFSQIESFADMTLDSMEGRVAAFAAVYEDDIVTAGEAAALGIAQTGDVSKEVFDQMIQDAAETGEAISSIMTAADAAAASFNGLAAAAEGAASAASSVPPPPSGSGGVSSGDTSNMPAYQHGGIVSHTQQAIIGEVPEAVIPLRGGSVPVKIERKGGDMAGALGMQQLVHEVANLRYDINALVSQQLAQSREITRLLSSTH